MRAIMPNMPASAYKTYQVVLPETGAVQASCADIDCEAYLCGWVTTVDETAEPGLGIARYIRTDSGRDFAEARGEDGLTRFTFSPGQVCFAASTHKVRRQIFAVRDGDFRGNPRGTEPRIHTRPMDWVEDFGEHQLRLADQMKEG